MARANTKFELTVEDMELIETALRDRQRQLNDDGAELRCETRAEAAARNISELLGRLHNQKVFYRPRQGVYVGG